MMPPITHFVYRTLKYILLLTFLFIWKHCFFSFHRLVLAEFTKWHLYFDTFRGHISDENQELSALNDIRSFTPIITDGKCCSWQFYNNLLQKTERNSRPLEEDDVIFQKRISTLFQVTKEHMQKCVNLSCLDYFT